jgi:hypothetical protein
MTAKDFSFNVIAILSTLCLVVIFFIGVYTCVRWIWPCQ